MITSGQMLAFLKNGLSRKTAMAVPKNRCRIEMQKNRQ